MFIDDLSIVIMCLYPYSTDLIISLFIKIIFYIVCSLLFGFVVRRVPHEVPKSRSGRKQASPKKNVRSDSPNRGPSIN